MSIHNLSLALEILRDLQAVEINDEKTEFDSIYDTLESYEACEIAANGVFEEVDDYFDEEEEIELAPVDREPAAKDQWYDIGEEFNRFSPSVGTSEGTELLKDITGRETAVGEGAD
jgi:hypothetical protein